MDLIPDILKQFDIPDLSYRVRPFHQGLINDTYFIAEGEGNLYVLQKVNEGVFKNIDGLIHNLTQLLPYLGGEGYHALSFVPVRTGGIFLRTRSVGTWRMMGYVQDSRVHNICEEPLIAFEAGRVLGRFHSLVPKADQLELQETLEDFHDLEKRATQYLEALSIADRQRVANAGPVLEFIDRTLTELRKAPLDGLPIRICHNDTKLNNVLFSSRGKGLCLIDLDTLMPGHFFYDFGDLARTVVNPVPENEKDLAKINFSLPMFGSLVKGLFSSGLHLEEGERRGLPWSVAYMPFLHGIRALTDYFAGDRYYKVSYPEENLDRARSLLYFAALALDHQGEMQDILSSFQS